MDDFHLTERGLWIPPSATIHRKRPVARCRVPTTRDGDVCGFPFYEGEDRAMIAHVRACTVRHLDAIHAFREKRHPSVMKPQDTELAKWVQETHKEAILEGRKKVGGGVV